MTVCQKKNPQNSSIILRKLRNHAEYAIIFLHLDHSTTLKANHNYALLLPDLYSKLYLYARVVVEPIGEHPLRAMAESESLWYPEISVLLSSFSSSPNSLISSRICWQPCENLMRAEATTAFGLISFTSFLNCVNWNKASLSISMRL